MILNDSTKRMIETYRPFFSVPETGESIEEMVVDETLASAGAVRSFIAAGVRAQVELLLQLEKAGLLKRP